MIMAFLGNLLKRFSRMKDAAADARSRMNPFVQRNIDPLQSWENISEIGDGAFGKVHRAINKVDNREAALKQILLESDEDMEDLMVEIDILVSCKHENIVELYEAYHHDNKLWLYLEFCAGGALDSIMHDLDRPLNEVQIRHVGFYVVRALEFLHSKFIIHRDLKAGNILLTIDGSVKLADFGVSARNAEEKQRRDTFIGTPFWMAPEVIACETMKDNPYDYRADVWSLGITLIELAEMNPPLHEMHPMRVMIKVQRAEPPRLRNPKKYSPEFSAFLGRCLVKEPSKRSKSSELLGDVFIKNSTDLKPLRQLVGELSAEVIETIEEGVTLNALNNSTISLGSLDRLDEKEDDRTSRGSSQYESPQLPRREKQILKTQIPVSPTTSIKSEDIFVSPNKELIPEPISNQQELVDEPKTSLETASCEEKSNESEKDGITMLEVPQSCQEEEPQDPEITNEIPTIEENGTIKDTIKDENKSVEDDNTKESLPRLQSIVISKGEQFSGDTPSPSICTFLPNFSVNARPVVVPKPSSSINISKPVEAPTSSVDVRKHVAEFENRMSMTAEPLRRARPPPPQRINSIKSELRSASPVVDVTPHPVAAIIDDKEAMSEAVYSSMLEEVLSSVTHVPSVASVVFDVMKDEMEAQLQIGDEEVVTTDIDDIIVNDNRTHEPEQPTPVPNGKVAPTRVDSGFGTVSATVTPVADDNKNLLVRDNRSEGKTDDGEAASSSTSGSLSGPVTKEDAGTSGKASTRRRQSHFRTLTRVRKFVIDGEEVTTTTSRVVVEGKETQHEEEYVNRKAGMREMKLLQKQEQRQHRDLVLRSQMQKDELDARLRQEEEALHRQYEQDLEALQRQQKLQLERAEVEHTNEIRFSSRRIRTSQDRELRSFRDLLKQEVKSVKQGIDAFPKDQRKEILKQRMEEKDLEHVERERDFQNKLAAQMSAEIDRMTVKHRRKLGQMENDFMRQRHKLRRRYEESRWELDETQMHLRHQKAREQLEEYFNLKRTQTAYRQGVEKEHLVQMVTKEKEFTTAAQTAEKKRFPKQLRTERKARMQMFRQSLRVPGKESLSSEEEKERIRQFEDQEQERMRFETERLMRKQSNKLSAMHLTHETMQRELEQLQAEKRKDLMDQETGKLREIDEAFRKNLVLFREALKEKRQKLEAELQEELRRQDEFYTQSDDGPNVQIRELPAEGVSPITDLDRVPLSQRI